MLDEADQDIDRALPAYQALRHPEVLALHYMDLASPAWCAGYTSQPPRASAVRLMSASCCPVLPQNCWQATTSVCFMLSVTLAGAQLCVSALLACCARWMCLFQDMVLP